MRLVEDHVVPRFAFENLCVPTCKTVRRDTDVELVPIIPTLSELLTTFRGPVVTQNLEAREELLELHFPVEKDTGRHNDEMRTPDASVAGKVSEKCDGLNGFTA